MRPKLSGRALRRVAAGKMSVSCVALTCLFSLPCVAQLDGKDVGCLL